MIENEDEEIKGETGTKTFLPPEVFEGKIVKGKSADIWAAGITFYLLSFG
jgi:[calcium/calmodulin-dependent protein kinase] kinase